MPKRSVRFSQGKHFGFDYWQIYKDPNLKRINESRMKQVHDQFLKENPFTEAIDETNKMFGDIKKFFKSSVSKVQRRNEREKEKNKDVSLVMANAEGLIEKFKVPSDLKSIIN